MSLLARLLSSSLLVTNVELKRFSTGHTTPDEVISSSRLIIIWHGRITYRVERHVADFGHGTMLLVPAWVRRVWRTTDKRGCELNWCEFSCPALELEPGGLLCARPADIGLERATIVRMHHEWSHGMPPNRLLLEGELKAQLARFFSSSRPFTKRETEEPDCVLGTDAEVDHALSLAESRYAEPDIMDTMRAASGLSAAHFRRVFKSRLRMSPGRFLLQLRMRHARYLLHETGKSIKEVCETVGYDDAFYFSRIYRRFWGCAPSADRGRGSAAPDPRFTAEVALAPRRAPRNTLR